MAYKYKLDCKILDTKKIIEGIYKFKIKAPEIAEISKAGQFLEIQVSTTGETFLRRPISIYNIEKAEGAVEFIFQVKGKGTKILANKEAGEGIDIIGPLGFGTFKYENYSNIAVIGGGIGVFPLYELSKCAKKHNKTVSTYLRFRNEDYVV